MVKSPSDNTCRILMPGFGGKWSMDLIMALSEITLTWHWYNKQAFFLCCCTVWTNEDTLLCADSHIKMNTWCTVAKTVSMKSNWPQACKTYPSLHNNKVLRYLIQRLKPLFPLQCTSVCSGLVKRIWGAESAWHENLLAKKNNKNNPPPLGLNG